MKLLGEKLVACLVEMSMGHCSVCGYTGQRILVLRTARQSERRVTLCGQHFTEACRAHPEIRQLESHRLNSRSKDAIRQVIHCPSCGAELELGERGSYKIILATVVTCSSCQAKVIVSRLT